MLTDSEAYTDTLLCDDLPWPTQREASGNPYMYTGREYDPETGLYFFRNRYQSPILGRFISEDPIGVQAGLNFYAYVGNNPINFTDPFGLWRSPSDIYDEALEDTYKRFSREDRWNGSGDAYRHCLASCMMSLENGNAVSAVFGWGNEKRGDYLKNQEAGERAMDDYNNAYGRNCAQDASNTEDCQAQCYDAAVNGALKTYKRDTTDGYWY